MAEQHVSSGDSTGEGVGDDVGAFLASIAEPRRRDAEQALALISDVTGAAPVLWGSSIVGFGQSSYRTADGKEHDWFVMGLSPRKANLTLYGLLGVNDDLLAQLGPHTTGKGCLYLKRLDDVNRDVLTQLVAHAWADHQS